MCESAELSYVAPVKAQEVWGFFCSPLPKVEVKAFQSVLSAVPRQQTSVVEPAVFPLFISVLLRCGLDVYIRMQS